MRVGARRFRWVVAHLFWNDGEPDLRVLQLGFTLALVGLMLLRAAGGRLPDLVSWPSAGLLASVVGGVVVLAVSRERVPLVSRAMAVVHDRGARHVRGRLRPRGSSPLLLLPVLWLGIDLGCAGPPSRSRRSWRASPCRASPRTAPMRRPSSGSRSAGRGGDRRGGDRAGLTAARRAQERAETREVKLEARARDHRAERTLGARSSRRSTSVSPCSTATARRR